MAEERNFAKMVATVIVKLPKKELQKLEVIQDQAPRMEKAFGAFARGGAAIFAAFSAVALLFGAGGGFRAIIELLHGLVSLLTSVLVTPFIEDFVSVAKGAKKWAEDFADKVEEEGIGDAIAGEFLDFFTDPANWKEKIPRIAGALGGAVLGWMAAGPWGAVAGAFIGALLVDNWSGVAGAFGGALIGWLVAGPWGAVAGSFIGALMAKDWASVAGMFGGAIFGFLLGGPWGAVAGAFIGGLIGRRGWESLGFTIAGGIIGGLLGGPWGAIGGAIAGAFLAEVMPDITSPLRGEPRQPGDPGQPLGIPIPSFGFGGVTGVWG